MKKPNIVLFLTDQQSSSMMGCAGNKYVRTPAMDSIAENGILFERAYCANPVCIPSRFSLMTGRMPSVIGLKSNAVRKEIPGDIPEYIKEQGIGYLLKNAGYDAVYGGKEHLPKLRATDIGFDYICPDERDELANVAADYIKQKHDKPYCFVVSLINPHDICYMAICEYAKTLDLEKETLSPEEHWIKAVLGNSKQEIECLQEAMKLPQGITQEEFFGKFENFENFEKYCPPLPANFETQKNEPAAIWAIKEQRKFKEYAHNNFTPEQWRMHRWAYCKLTEKADAQIGKVLDAIKQSDDADNTVVIFTSDHGDMDSAHRMEHKTALYEEACRIPLLISQPSMPEKGIRCNNLISNGLDIIPTICDYAGIAPPEDLTGKSVKAIVENTNPKWREMVHVESEFGKLAVTNRYKYAMYDEGENNEQLYDLEIDPNEMQNFAGSVDHQETLDGFRENWDNRDK